LRPLAHMFEAKAKAAVETLQVFRNTFVTAMSSPQKQANCEQKAVTFSTEIEQLSTNKSS
jgi:hypothetical protein